jgi:hypothetical protein
LGGLGFDGRLLRLGSGVVECDFDANLSSVLAFAGELMPFIALAAAGDDDVAQIDPYFSN